MQLFNVLADYDIFGAHPGMASGAFDRQSNSMNTPLSSKARPFNSCRDARAETILAGVALVEEALFRPSLLPTSRPFGPDCSDGMPPPQESLKCGGLSWGRDNDFRRRDLWAAGLRQSISRTPSPFGGSAERWDGRTWSGSTRTPSPPNDGEMESLASDNASDIPDMHREDEIPETHPENYVHPVKHTFIHYDAGSSLDEDDVLPEKCFARSASAPSLLMESEFFHLKARKPAKKGSPQIDKSHEDGTCTPCAYFYRKADSCRSEGECKFCHLCPPEALKQYKKARLKGIRAKVLAERSERKQKRAARERAEEAKKEEKA